MVPPDLLKNFRMLNYRNFGRPSSTVSILVKRKVSQSEHKSQLSRQTQYEYIQAGILLLLYCHMLVVFCVLAKVPKLVYLVCHPQWLKVILLGGHLPICQVH